MTDRVHFVQFCDVDTRKPVFVRPEHVAAVEERALGGVRLVLAGARPLAVCGTTAVIAKTLEIASLRAALFREHESETEPA